MCKRNPCRIMSLVSAHCCCASDPHRLGLLPHAGAPWSLQRLLGFAMAPLAWAAGVPWHEAGTAGGLLGTKVVLNELIAYIDLAALPAEALSPSSRLIMTYALCGFANLPVFARQADDKNGFYYQNFDDAIVREGDVIQVLDVLARDVGIMGIFSDWPATVTYYASCMGLK